MKDKLLPYKRFLHNLFHKMFVARCWFEGVRLLKHYNNYPWTLLMFETSDNHRFSRPLEKYMIIRANVETQTQGKTFITQEEYEDGFFEECVESLKSLA